MASLDRLEGTLALGGLPDLHLHAVRVHEELSRPTRVEVDFTGPPLDPKALRGVEASVHLKHAVAGERFFAGVVERLSVALSKEGAPRCRAVVVPQPTLLAHRLGFRIHQEKSVPEIVKLVLKDAGIPEKAVEDKLQGKYAKRTYCVQYDESEWAFISRLLEEEGIHYAFVHSEDGVVLSLRDVSDGSPESAPDSLPYNDQGGAQDDLVRLWAWQSEERVTVTKVTLNDYDGLKPSAPMVSEVKVSDPGSGEREWYEYPAGFADVNAGKALAQRRLDAIRVARHQVRARTNALSVQVGTVLEVTDHPSGAGKYLVVASDLDARIDPEEEEGPLVEKGGPGHSLQLTLIPKKVPFRPERITPKPLIAGVQTVRITGPKGEEIHCDKHGRVKVQFHWDRHGKLDDHTSCWIRVVQAHTTGSVMVPRIGWETIVEFQGGDPDRPLVGGRLYNPHYLPPVELPAKRTVSGHISHSSPGGAGVNAVQFDDTAGSEKLEILGHKDVALKVANNQKLKTAKNESRMVGKNHEAKVGADETMTVGADATLKVGKKQSLTVGAKRSVKVDGMIVESVKGEVKVDVSAAQMFQVGNPASAVLQVIASSAIAAAQGLAAAGVGRAQASLLAPLQPALGAARGALGGMAVPGPAGALLSGNPSMMMTALAAPPGPQPPDGRPSARGMGEMPEASLNPMAEVSAMASGAAGAIAGGALAKLGLPAPSAGGGGGGGGGPAPVGDGTWGVTVNGKVTEKIGGVAAINSLQPISFGIGGASKEMVGAARIEVIRGSKTEISTGAKLETVAGLYMIDAKEGLSIDAGAALATTIAGARKLKIGTTHAVSAEGLVAITASRLKVNASDNITLKCGLAELVIDSSGVSISGTNVTVKGSSKLTLDEPAIKPG